MSQKVEVLVASAAGVCFGVERALNLSEKAVQEKAGPLFSLGPIIHNPQTVENFQSRGLTVADSLDAIEGTVIFRSHGVTKQVVEQAKAKNLKVVDATCPLVKVPQNFARRLSEAGYFVVIVGDSKHPEIQGVRSYVDNGEVAVVKGPEEVAGLPQRDKVGVICQTTLKKPIFDAVIEECKKRYPEVKVHNTICSATKDRQEAAVELANQVDCVVVIGGRNSSNTQKLFEICKEISKKAFLIETEAELSPEWFAGCSKIGVTAGASTPQAVLECVRDRIQQMTN